MRGPYQSASAHVVTSMHRSGYYRLERQLPGGIRTRKESAPFHGARKYSIYTVPSTREWVVVVNASTSQGGLTRDEGQFRNQYVPEVRAQEVGRSLVMSEPAGEHVEQFTIRSEQTGSDSAHIVLEWERTRVRIPVRVSSATR